MPLSELFDARNLFLFDPLAETLLLNAQNPNFLKKLIFRIKIRRGENCKNRTAIFLSSKALIERFTLMVEINYN